MTGMNNLLHLAMLTTLVLGLAAEGWSQDAFAQQRRELAHRKRRIILNNDGNEVIYYPKDLPVTVENVLAQRTSPLLGSQVDTIFYCPISSGFSYFTHNTKAGTVLEHPIFGSRNIARDLIDMATDALKMIVDYGHANNIEVFFSMRMNDTHDGAHSPDKPYPLFPPLKAEHPEYLIGSLDNKPKYGQWSAVDYGRPEVRELAFEYLEEVCQNYDVDGIELDFWRHLCYFKSVAYGGTASQAELDMMTDLLRRVRTMADAEGRKRGRPILIAVRVPDSVEYSRAVGLDIERWLKEGLVDVLVGTCYFQLNPWEYLVELGHRYDVPVYPCLSESRVRAEGPPYRRQSQESYRARAARVWQSGADGVYTFNFFAAKSPLLREMGDPAVLAKLDKTYFATVRNYTANMSLADGKRFQNVPVLTPDQPLTLPSGKAVTVPLMLGETPEAAATAKIRLNLLTTGSKAPQVRLNGQEVPAPEAVAGWWQYPVAAQMVKPGRNEVEMIGAAPRDGSDEWDVTWTGDKKPALPWGSDKPGARTLAEVQDGALLVADRGTQVGDYLYYTYAWNADPERETVAELEAKVISGLSSVMFSNGVALERLYLKSDGLSLGTLKYPMDTTDAFHTYRIVVKGQDMKVLVDGKLALDAPGKFLTESPAGRNALQFGAANSYDVGEALWRAVRMRGVQNAVADLVMTFDYP